MAGPDEARHGRVGNGSVDAAIAGVTARILAPILRRTDTPRWWTSAVAGLVVMIVSGAALLVIGWELEQMHLPGDAGYGAQGLFSTTHIHDAMEQWSRYWLAVPRDPALEGLAKLSPQALSILWLVVDLMFFIAGYVMFAGTFLLRAGRHGTRTFFPRLAAHLLVLVALLDAVENLSSIAVVSSVWPEVPSLGLARAVAAVTIAKSLAGIPVLFVLATLAVRCMARAWTGRRT